MGVFLCYPCHFNLIVFICLANCSTFNVIFIYMVNITYLLTYLHTPSLKSSFPKEAGPYSIPTVVNTLGPTIQSSIFNYNKFVENLDIDAFLNNENNLPCNCQNSSFADSHHGHIVTGDLRIITNAKLRKLMVKGPKYREPVNINFEKAKDEIVKGINENIKQLSNKFGISGNVFGEWKGTVLKLLDERITELRNKTNILKNTPVLEQQLVKEDLNKIHEQYVLTPIDKAGGNIAIICKRFYAKILIKELGINNSAENTYEQVTSRELEGII